MIEEKKSKIMQEIEKAERAKKRADKKLAELKRKAQEENNSIKLSVLDKIMEDDSFIEYLKANHNIDKKLIERLKNIYQ